MNAIFTYKSGLVLKNQGDMVVIVIVEVTVSRLLHPGGGNVAEASVAQLNQHYWEKHLATLAVDL